MTHVQLQGKVAILFAGQGAQAPGMGQEIANASEAACRAFKLADEIRPGTSEQCFAGTADELTQTRITQPCLFAVDLACVEALREAGIEGDMAAGFSLGEIPALAFTGMLSAEDAFRLVCERANRMDECAQKTPGAMAAVLGCDNAAIEAICTAHGVYPVNYNCPGQLVIAGEADNLAAAVEEIKRNKGRVVPLAVSGAFHTPSMQEASDALVSFCEGVSFLSPRIPLYANLTAQPYGEDPVSTIAQQVVSPVRWQETIEAMAEAGATTFIEVGPGKTLSGLVRKTIPDALACNVCDEASLAKTVEALS